MLHVDVHTKCTSIFIICKELINPSEQDLMWFRWVHNSSKKIANNETNLQRCISKII